MRQSYWRVTGAIWLVVLVYTSVALGVGFTMPGGTIAFETNRAGNSEIFLADTSRRLLLNVSQHPAIDNNPAWSPDGNRIAFETFGSQRDFNVSALGGGGKTIYVLDMDNRAQVQFDPITRRNVVGSRAWRATPRNLQAIDPSWSPDGTKLLVSAWTSRMGQIQDIFTIRIYNQAFQQITDTPRLSEHSASWSPDGRYIVFGSIDPDRGVPDDIFVTPYRERGLGLVQFNPAEQQNALRVSDQENANYPIWTPDGRIVYYDATERRLFTTGLDDENRDEPLLDTGYTMEDVALSPDGEWLVFSSAPQAVPATPGGQTTLWRALYIMRTDGTELRRITFGNEVGSYLDLAPSWRPR